MIDLPKKGKYALSYYTMIILSSSSIWFDLLRSWVLYIGKQCWERWFNYRWSIKIFNKSSINCCESDSKLEFWKQKIGGRFSGHGGQFSTLFFGLWFENFRWPNGCIRWPILRRRNKNRNVFLSLDLFQFYEGYFYYKYRLCIRVNLEIEGVETRV